MAATVDAAIVVAADHRQLFASLARMRGQSPDRWLPPSAAKVVPRSWSAVRRSRDQDIIDCVAVSAPSHCVDGWGYASRAISALLCGDVHAARHLAYYAQLRAAMSILANLGIGIFNQINLAISTTGSIVRIDPDPTRSTERGLGTHKAVWETLEKWSTSASAGKFLELVRLKGTTLDQCLDALWPGYSATSVVAPLIEAWGLDLRRGSDDHISRNVSSYEPQAIHPLNCSITQSIDFLSKMWRALEPSGAGGFDQLDRFLLRNMFWRQHQVISSGIPLDQGAMGKEYDKLPAVIRSLTPKQFLLGKIQQQDHDLIVKARSRSRQTTPIEMLARATLLLRIATAFSHTNLAIAGIGFTHGDLRPWLDKLAIDRGFWTGATPLAEPIDLWADISNALDSIDAVAPKPIELHSWQPALWPAGVVITQAERAGVWSFTS